MVAIIEAKSFMIDNQPPDLLTTTPNPRDAGNFDPIVAVNHLEQYGLRSALPWWVEGGHIVSDYCHDEGGMCSIYLGVNPNDEIRAYKVTLPLTHHEFDNQLHREALIMQSLSHPNIPVIDGYYTNQRVPGTKQRNGVVMVMEYIKGQDLKRISRFDPLPPEEIVHMATDIGSALQCGHENGIVHRDVKPGNILLDETTHQWKIIDYGIAHLTKEANQELKDFDRQTRQPGSYYDALIGTPRYMAPEMGAQMTERIGPHSDQFSLGILLYEMIAGQHPFSDSKESMQMIMDIFNHSYQEKSLFTLDPATQAELGKWYNLTALNQVFVRTFTLEPNGRYPSIIDMVNHFTASIL